MEFDIEKYAMLVMKNGKRHIKEGVELPNQVVRSVNRKRTNTWGYWKLTHSNKWKWKKKLKEYLRRARKLLGTKLYCRNLVKRIHTWAVPFVRYSGPFLKWTREKLKQMDQRTRKLLTVHKAWSFKWWRWQIIWVKKRGGRGLASIKTVRTHQYNGSETI